MKNYEGQMNWFEMLDPGRDPDSLSSKTYPESLAVTKEKTSEQSLKKPLESLNRKHPVFLYLKVDGRQRDWCMGTDGPLHGQYTTPSTTEFLKEEDESLWCPTTGGYLPIRSCLSAILAPADSRYHLSAKACQGILNRAERRGKELPEILKKALLRQASDGSVGGERIEGES